jgi:ADP-ribose pyrophosphatase YjhB (NUDIX family)
MTTKPAPIPAGKQAGDKIKGFINIGLITNEKNEILVVRRLESETGLDGVVLDWQFPGGEQNYGESRFDCVKRCVKAKTGYDVEPVKQISIRMHPQFPVTVAAHSVNLTSPEPSNSPEGVREIKWVKTEELANLITSDIDPKVKNFLRI